MIKLLTLLFLLFFISCMPLLTTEGRRGAEEVVVISDDSNKFNNYLELKKEWDELNKTVVDSSYSSFDLDLLEELTLASFSFKGLDLDFDTIRVYIEILEKSDNELEPLFLSIQNLISLEDSLKNITNEFKLCAESLTINKKRSKNLKYSISILHSENDSLKIELQNQQEMIEKLKKLEMLMDADRKRFK
jgi:hypothetical protein